MAEEEKPEERLPEEEPPEEKKPEEIIPEVEVPEEEVPEEEEHKNVIIKIVEKETCVLNPDCDVKEISVEGLLSITNPSTRHRIWAGDLNLENVGGTDLRAGHYAIPELEPLEKWEKDFSVDVKKPILEINEDIDTYFTPGEEMLTGDLHGAFVFQEVMPTLIRISLKNPTSLPVTNVVVHKTLPEGFDDPDIDTSTMGDAHFLKSKRTVVWENFELSPNQEVFLTFKTRMIPRTTNPIAMGEIIVTYEVHSQSISKIEPEIDSLCKTMFSVDQDESEEEPGKWDCEIEFENSSDLVVYLEDVKVLMDRPDGTKVAVVELVPKTAVNPERSWSYDFNVRSAEIPVFEKFIKYRVVQRVEREIYSQITKLEDNIPVARLDAAKDFSPPVVDTYGKTPMSVTLTSGNVGSAEIDTLIYTDKIPAYFHPPAEPKTDVRVTVNGTSWAEEVIDIKITPEEVKIDPLKEHTLTITLKDLRNTIKGQLQPGEKVTITYPIVAWQPPPGITYDAPLEVRGKVYPHGTDIVATARGVAGVEAEEEAPKIGIKYAKRKLRVGKSLIPGVEKGEYEIELHVQNKGDVELEGIKVEDWIPDPFQLVSWEPKFYEVAETKVEDGTEVAFAVSRIKPGQKLVITYSTKGEGEYRSREPKVTVPPVSVS